MSYFPAKLIASATIISLSVLLWGCPSDSEQEAFSNSDAGLLDAPGDGTFEDTTGQDAPMDVDQDGDAQEPNDGAVLPDADASGPWAPYGVLSLNLHCLRLTGTSFTTNTERFTAIAQAVAAENIGAIAVQEACISETANALDLLRQALDSTTGHSWSAAFAFAHMAWEGTPEEAEEGVGLLVRGPLSNVETFDYGAQDGLHRVAIAGTLPASLGALRLVSVHLDHKSAPAREAQARETASLAMAWADPSLDIIVAGDFNATTGTAALGAMGSFGFLDLTAPLGPGRIDHIFAHRASAVLSTETAILFDGTTYPIVSDHKGMLVRLAPATGDTVAVTRLRATAALGAKEYLSVRGSDDPLSWTQGWSCWQEPSGTWKLVLTELPAAAFSYKFLRNDVDWQTGEDQEGTGGTDHVIVPTF